MSEKISRRDFLKIIGAAGAGLTLGGIGFATLLKDRSATPASAQTYGSWQMGGQTHATPIHSAALYNGKVLYVAGSGFYGPNELGPFELGIYDPATDTDQPLPAISGDMFCVGHSQLPNGNILFTGGTLSYDNRSANGKWLGLKGAWIYDVPSNTLRPIAPMAHGRWYPTQVLLADGKVLVVGGWDEYGSYNKLTEIFDPAAETWTIKYDPSTTTGYCVGEGQDPAIMPGAGQPCYGPGVAPAVLLYPRMHLMPGGLVAVCGQSKTLRTFNPATGEWKFAGNMLLGGSRGYGSSLLLPLQNTAEEKGSILIFGGTITADDYATTNAEILTPSGTSLQPRWTAPSQFGRKHPIPVMMPDGKILVIGGTAFQNLGSTKIMEAELFDPVAETWTTLPAMTVPRQYHSSAVLLPDGRVWAGGTTYSKTSRELRVEYFVPHYYNSAGRPAISGTPTVGYYGETITVPTPDGLDIDAVSLVMQSTETHAYNCDQRLIWLQIQNKTAAEVVVSAPINANIAPPGFYYLHVLKAGIPSAASIIKVPGDALPPQPDATLPAISIASPADNETIAGPSSGIEVTVTGTASDSESGLQVIEVSVDGGAFSAATGTQSWSFTTAQLALGPHTIAARATDNAGNVAGAAIGITIEEAGGAPPGELVSIYSVAGTNSYGLMYSTGSSSDFTGQGEKVTAASSLVGKPIRKVAVILKKAGSPTGTIYIRVRDSADTVVREIGTVEASALTAADQRLEVTDASSSPYTLKANDQVLAEWAGTGSSADVIYVKRHGSDAFEGSSAYFVSRKAGGSYTSGITRDLAGEWYSGGSPSPPPSDTVIPAIAISSPSEGDTLAGTEAGLAVEVTGTASDAESGLQAVEVSVDGGAFSAATGTQSWSFTTAQLAAGSHAITARAKDNAGNMAETTVNVTIESAAPPPGGSFVSIYSVAGTNSYGAIASTGSSSDFTGQGEKILSASSLVGKPIRKVAVVMKKAGNPAGTINVRVRDASDAVVLEVGAVDAALLTAADQRLELTSPSARTLQADDKILVEWAGTGSSADVIYVKRHGSDAFEGSSAYFVSRKAGGSYTNGLTRDLAGDWYQEA